MKHYYDSSLGEILWVFALFTSEIDRKENTAFKDEVNLSTNWTKLLTVTVFTKKC